VTLAREDPHHQIDTPEAKRKKSREDEELWSYALSKPPPGKYDREADERIKYQVRLVEPLSSQDQSNPN